MHTCTPAQVTGIEGNFCQTCNNVMRVLRENKDSVMAVLEAFVYDPLLNWRLIDGERRVGGGGEGEQGGTEGEQGGGEAENGGRERR